MTNTLKKKIIIAIIIIIAVLLGCGILAASSFGALIMCIVSFVLGIVATKAVQKALSLKEDSTE